MAKLPALVAALAKVDGREKKTVEHVARLIREAKFIPTLKRGTGAAEMKTGAAANLIMALNGADSPKYGPRAIEQFRSLRQRLIGPNRQPYRFEDLPEPIHRLSNAEYFGDALEIIIDGVPELYRMFKNYLDEAYDGNYDSVDSALALDFCGLSMEFRRYHVTIEIFRTEMALRHVDFHTTFVPDASRLDEGLYTQADSDRRLSVTIGMRTFIAAWNGLHSGGSLNR